MRKYGGRQRQLAEPVELKSFLVPGPQCQLYFDSKRSYHDASQSLLATGQAAWLLI